MPFALDVVVVAILASEIARVCMLLPPGEVSAPRLILEVPPSREMLLPVRWPRVVDETTSVWLPPLSTRAVPLSVNPAVSESLEPLLVE
jgi:hypothetical protein